jgi:hypothetical protein
MGSHVPGQRQKSVGIALSGLAAPE